MVLRFALSSSARERLLRSLAPGPSCVKQQIADATKALQEEEQADQAEETLARASQAVLAKIAELRKRLS
jgi:hypothetical protein